MLSCTGSNKLTTEIVPNMNIYNPKQNTFETGFTIVQLDHSKELNWLSGSIAATVIKSADPIISFDNRLSEWETNCVRSFRSDCLAKVCVHQLKLSQPATQKLQVANFENQTRVSKLAGRIHTFNQKNYRIWKDLVNINHCFYYRFR